MFGNIRYFVETARVVRGASEFQGVANGVLAESFVFLSYRIGDPAGCCA